MGLASVFPASSLPGWWRTDVIVLRGGGRDARGNPLPAEEIEVKDCLIGPRATSEGEQFMVTSTDMAIYRDPDPEFSFRSSDRIRIPEGSRMAGEWAVDGRPLEYPLGVHVPIRSA